MSLVMSAISRSLHRRVTEALNIPVYQRKSFNASTPAGVKFIPALGRADKGGPPLVIGKHWPDDQAIDRGTHIGFSQYKPHRLNTRHAADQGYQHREP